MKEEKCSRTHGMDYLADLTCSTTHLQCYNNMKDVPVVDVASNHIENSTSRRGHIYFAEHVTQITDKNYSCMSKDSARSFNEDHGWVHVQC